MGRKLNKSSTKKPSFFKIMVGDFDEKLRVPVGFIRHFNGKLPHKSILRSSTGRSWTIQVTKVGNDLFFSNGWHAFVNDHSLEFGDLLFFRYKGESKFNVKIYGRTGCKKEVPFNHEEPMSNVKKEKYEEPMPYMKKEKEGKNPETRKPAMQIEEKTGAVVEALSVKSKCPHFIAIWTQSTKYRLTIPRGFAIENGLKTKKSIVLQDPEGRSWPVVIYQREDGRVYMTNGWQRFCEANRLADGDTCRFEFLDRRKGNRMSVRIFRMAEVEKPSSLMLKGSTSTATRNVLTKRPKAAYLTTHADERAIKIASAFESEHPFCTVIMRSSFVHEPFAMNVPSAFGMAYLLRKTEIVTIRVSDERSWQVRCGFSKNRTRLYKGWKDFVLDNLLKEGDVCVFELVERKKFEMNVSIFRVSQDVV